MKFVKFPTQTKKNLNPNQVPSFGYSAMVSCQGGHGGGCWEGVVMVGVGWWWFVAVNGGLVGFSCWEWCFVLVCDVASTVSYILCYHYCITVINHVHLFERSVWLTFFLGFKQCLGCFVHKVNQPCLTMAIYGYDCAPKQRRQVEYDPGQAFLRSVPWQL